MKRLLLASILAFGLAACGGRSDDYNHKAVASTAAAEAIVGGFSDADRKLYTNGIQEAYRTHSKPGQYTIAQIIDQEAMHESYLAESPQQLARENKEANEFNNREEQRNLDEAQAVPVRVIH